jgi:hypothetical protein
MVLATEEIEELFSFGREKRSRMSEDSDECGGYCRGMKKNNRTKRDVPFRHANPSMR